MTIFAVGSTDRLFFRLHISYEAQIHFWRVGIWVIPIVVFFATRSICRSLARSGTHPLRQWDGAIVDRAPDGGFEVLAESPRTPEPPGPRPPVGTVPGRESEL